MGINMVFVYFIRCGQRRGAIKIGHASNVERRLLELQVGNPEKLHVLATIPIESKKQAHNIERWMHYRFKRLHIRGEWFRGSLKLKTVFTNLELAKNGVDYDDVCANKGKGYHMD